MKGKTVVCVLTSKGLGVNLAPGQSVNKMTRPAAKVMGEAGVWAMIVPVDGAALKVRAYVALRHAKG